MKNISLLFIFLVTLLFHQEAFAQNEPYASGLGDGYDSHTFQVLSGPAGDETPIQISPTILLEGNEITIRITPVKRSIRIRIYGVNGQLVQELANESGTSSYQLKKNLVGIAAATYILEIIVDENRFTEKIVVLSP